MGWPDFTLVGDLVVAGAVLRRRGALGLGRDAGPLICGVTVGLEDEIRVVRLGLKGVD